MTPKSARVLLVCALFTTMFSAPANAEDCKLGRIGSVDFTEKGAIVIPVSIEGNNSAMAIDTGAMLSGVDPESASNFHLITHRIYQGMAYDAKGEQFTQMAVMHAFTIGEMRASDVRMLVWPSRMWGDAGVAGTLGQTCCETTTSISTSARTSSICSPRTIAPARSSIGPQTMWPSFPCM